MGESIPEVHEAIRVGDSVLEIAHKVLQSDQDAIADTRHVLNEQALGQAVEALVRAKKIEFIGIGSSMPVALDAYYRFARIGFPVSCVTDSSMQRVACGFLDEDSVAFAISHTGRTRDTWLSFKTARDQGATCILLTSHRGTRIGSLADIELVTASRETAFRTEAMSSRIAHLSLIDALYVAVALRTDAARDALQRVDTLFADDRF